jgi:hypothetical protein
LKNNQRRKKPLARKEGLVIRELPDEVLIYDTETDHAHCLNETAAFVWQRCDGRKSPAEITRELSLKKNVRLDDKIVWLAIDQLWRNRLLIDSPLPPPTLRGINRRDMVRALGLTAAVAVPVVASIVAPQPAEAASCLPGGAQCGSSAQCCSQLCNQGVCAST